MAEGDETRFAVSRAELEREIAHLRELLVERDRALELQAREYERRLTALNGEADRLRGMQLSYIPREVYEADQRELRQRAEALKETAIVNAGRIAASESAVAGLREGLTWLTRLLVGAVVTGVIALVATYWRR